MKLPYHVVERTTVARELHEKYYTALAEGDMSTINKIACKGLIQQSQRSISQRRDSTALKFSILGYRGMQYPQSLRWPLLSILPFNATKIVSDKVAPLPFGQNNLLRQVVVRISSRQELQTPENPVGKKADLTEYVVIQRMRMDGVDEGWKLWGTTKQSTMKDIETILGGTSSTAGFIDTFKEQASKLTGV